MASGIISYDGLQHDSNLSNALYLEKKYKHISETFGSLRGARRFILKKYYRVDNWLKIYNGYPNF